MVGGKFFQRDHRLLLVFIEKLLDVLVWLVEPGKHVLLKRFRKLEVVEVEVDALLTYHIDFSALVKLTYLKHLPLDLAARLSETDFSDLHKDLLREVLHRFIVFYLDMQQITVHLQKLNPELFKRVKNYHAFAPDVKHHKRDFVLLVFGAVINNVHVNSVVDHVDEVRAAFFVLAGVSAGLGAFQLIQRA